jgi:hypothetical protein
MLLEGTLMQNFQVHSYNDSNIMVLRTSDMTGTSVQGDDDTAFKMKDSCFENKKLRTQQRTRVYTSVDDD